VPEHADVPMMVPTYITELMPANYPKGEVAANLPVDTFPYSADQLIL